MDEMEDLAAAARQAWRRPYQPKQSNKPVVITVIAVIGVLIGLGVILWINKPAPPRPAPPPVVVEAVTGPDLEGEALDAEKTRAVHARFNAFTSRLSGLLGKAQQAALQAAGEKDRTYACNYTVRRTDVEPAKDTHSPRLCDVTLTGSVDWTDDDNNSEQETYKITATFEDSNGSWTIAKATSERLTHKDSAGLFGDPVKIGAIKNLAHIDWFNEAVAGAERAN